MYISIQCIGRWWYFTWWLWQSNEKKKRKKNLTTFQGKLYNGDSHNHWILIIVWPSNPAQAVLMIVGFVPIFYSCSGTPHAWSKYQMTWWMSTFHVLVKLNLNWSCQQHPEKHLCRWGFTFFPFPFWCRFQKSWKCMCMSKDCGPESKCHFPNMEAFF